MNSNNYPSSGFSKLERSMVSSKAYRTLDPYSRSLLMEFIIEHNGHNNGSISLSHRVLAHRANVSRNRADKSILELISRGFICRTYLGRRISENKKISSKWEITCFPVKSDEGTFIPASMDFNNWNEKEIIFDNVSDINEIKKPIKRKREKNKIRKISNDYTNLDLEKPDFDDYEIHEYDYDDCSDINF